VLLAGAGVVNPEDEPLAWITPLPEVLPESFQLVLELPVIGGYLLAGAAPASIPGTLLVRVGAYGSLPRGGRFDGSVMVEERMPAPPGLEPVKPLLGFDPWKPLLPFVAVLLPLAAVPCVELETLLPPAGGLNVGLFR
jgi:hypothetical protein